MIRPARSRFARCASQRSGATALWPAIIARTRSSGLARTQDCGWPHFLPPWCLLASVDESSIDREEAKAMRKLLVFALFVTLIAAVVASSAAAKPRGTNGKIVFNSDNSVTGQEQVYTVDPETGTDLALLATDTRGRPKSGHRTAPRSDLRRNPQLRYRQLHRSVPVHSVLRICSSAAGPGRRMRRNTPVRARALGSIRPSMASIPSAPPTAATSNGSPRTYGGDDCPGDYSPNGKRIVFVRANDTVQANFTTNPSTAVGYGRSRRTAWPSTSTVGAGRRPRARSCSRPMSPGLRLPKHRSGLILPTAANCGRSSPPDAAAFSRARHR